MKKFLLLIIVAIGFMLPINAADPAAIVVPSTTQTNNFVLYPTFNMYTFLKLDTRNGKIWQVQYSMGDDEFEVPLNRYELVTTSKPGRFALYPTTNNWTFLLLDTEDGNVWHVQWSQEAYNRVIIPIHSMY